MNNTTESSEKESTHTSGKKDQVKREDSVGTEDSKAAVGTKVTIEVNKRKERKDPDERQKASADINCKGSAKEASHKRKASTDTDGPCEKKAKQQKLVTKAEIHQCFSRLTLSEELMKELDYPRPSGKEGQVKLYGNHFGFREGCCKRCDKWFDTTFKIRSQCDFHMQRSKRFNGGQQPHGCCGRRYGSSGCRTAPSHVHQGNLYLDLENYKSSQVKEDPEEKYTVYAVDTESIHTLKGLEVCRVTVVDRKLKVVYNEFCLPTSEVVDYNTMWSGITEKDLERVTKTFHELREDMLKLFSADTILVGHGLSSDLIAMKIVHNNVIDTLYLYPHHRGWPMKRSLKDIALTELGMRIQNKEGHDSAEDAIVAMKLVQKKVRPMLKKLNA